MLVNDSRKTSREGHVEFISYDGSWPCRCMGVLTVKIDGEIVKFGHHSMKGHWNEKSQRYEYEDENPEKPNYNTFWSSGGRVWFSDNYSESHIEKGEWEIDVNDIPDKYKSLAKELDDVFNTNVPWGCCGGCI